VAAEPEALVVKLEPVLVARLAGMDRMQKSSQATESAALAALELTVMLVEELQEEPVLSVAMASALEKQVWISENLCRADRWTLHEVWREFRALMESRVPTPISGKKSKCATIRLALR
jgi:hypothetical protein